MTDSGRILVADDEEIFLLATANLLRNAGYTCDSASDSFAAIQMLKAQKYDLLISDINMPGNTELALIRDLPQIAEGMPTILVTGYPSIDLVIDAIKLPVSAYLTKPIPSEQLLNEVHTSIENHRIYQSTKQMMQRQLIALRDLIESGKELSITAPKNKLTSVNAFLSLTLQNIAGSLLDINVITNRLTQKVPQTQEVCHLFNCPRHAVLINTLEEAVKVLEKTKNSFKSIELRNLRRKLTNILDNKGIDAE